MRFELGPRALAALRRQDQHADRTEDPGGEDAADVGRCGRRDHRDERAEPEGAGAQGGGRGHGRSGAVGERLRLGAPVERLDDALRLTADRLEERAAIGLERAHVLPAQEAAAMRAAALRELRGEALPLPQVLLDEPVDQLGDAALDDRRSVGDDPLLELPLDSRTVQQVEDAPDAQGVLDEGLAARSHLDKHLLDRRHPQLEAALQVLAVERELPGRRVERLDVRPEHGEPLGGHHLVARGERAADAERVGQLQPEALVVVEGVAQKGFERAEAARRPLLGIAVLGPPCPAAR